MKSILLVTLLSCSTTVAFGQGQVQFRNYVTSTTPAIDAPVYFSVSGPLLDSSNPLWRAALIGGPTTATVASWRGPGTLQMMFYPATDGTTTISWVTFRSGTTPPAAPGYVATGLSAARAVPGVDWGGTALVQMVAWQGNFTTWQDAWSAFQWGYPDVLIGMSNPLTLKLPSSPSDLNATYLWGLNSFAIFPVPEPTTFALAGIGVGALLMCRGRKGFACRG